MTQINLFVEWLKARYTGEDRGASLVEYVLLVALIAVVCIVAISFLGDTASTTFSDTGDSLATTGGAAGGD